MPQPGKGDFPGLGLSAGGGKGEQLRHGVADSPSHPRGELSPMAGLRHTAVTAQAKGTSNVTLLIISLYPGGKCSIRSLQLMLINAPSLHGESHEWKLTGEPEPEYSEWLHKGHRAAWSRGFAAHSPIPGAGHEEALTVARFPLSYKSAFCPWQSAE